MTDGSLLLNQKRERVIGVMQGRLSPRPPGKLQAFPIASWREEFFLAKKLGFDGIEWIYEADRSSDNPLTHTGGRRSIRETITETSTRVLSICGDYFMVHRLSEENTRAHAISELARTIDYAAEVGATRILLPLLEEAALDTPEKGNLAIESLREVAPHAAARSISLGLEMEIPAPRYRSIIERVGHPNVQAYYDTGNSTAQGIDVGSDIHGMLDVLLAVHIKDRRIGGSSQFLGHGETNFAGLFAALRASNFGGELVLQHYFEDPVADAGRALAFIRQYWPEGSQ